MSTQPPASKLCEDVLWHIFDMNTPSDDHFLNPDATGDEIHSLTTARHTSQVCSDWRAIILESPSVWANSLRLEDLNQRSNYWRKEVLRRTGSCLLSIHGSFVRRYVAQEFLMCLLEHHWPRFRRICIRAKWTTIFCDRRWCTFTSPAPNLEILGIHFERERDTPSLSFFRKLFDGNAPRLHTFSASLVDFQIQHGSFSELWSLELTGTIVSPAILPVLQGMNSLRLLKLVNQEILFEFNRKSKHPRIKLPKLRNLHIDADMRNFLTIARHIHPPQQCKIALIINDISDRYSPRTWRTLGQCFHAYYRCIMDQHPINTLSISIQDYCFSIRNRRHNEDISSPEDPLFSFQIEWIDDESWDNISNLILHSVLSVDPLPVKTFNMLMEFEATDLSIDEYLTELLYSLISVEVLYGNSLTLKLISDIEDQNDGRNLFLRLNTLVLEEEYCGDSENAIQLFVQRRIKAGLPVRSIDLTEAYIFDDDILLFLKDQEGLEVITLQEA